MVAAVLLGIGLVASLFIVVSHLPPAGRVPVPNKLKCGERTFVKSALLTFFYVCSDLAFVDYSVCLS